MMTFSFEFKMLHPDEPAPGMDWTRYRTSKGMLGAVAARLRESSAFAAACEDAPHDEEMADRDARALVKAVVRAIGSAEAFDALRREIEALGEGEEATLLCQGAVTRTVRLPLGDGVGIAWLHANGEVLDERYQRAEVELDVRLSAADWARFDARRR